MRCSHSQKKFALKPASVMPRLIALYSGICLYFSNSSTHPASVSGGITPATGRHSVIDSPDSVRRVMPPTATTMITSSATAQSQRASAAGRGWRVVGAGEVEICVIAPPYRRLQDDRQEAGNPAIKGNSWSRQVRSEEHTSELQSLMSN